MTESKVFRGYSSLKNVNATRAILRTIGIIFGIAGMNHGLFEALQGFEKTPGLIIQAIGPQHRFWRLGTEEAFTIIPNFLITGIAAMIIGFAIIIWSIKFIDHKRSPTIFLTLFIALFLFGGGIGQIIFFIPAWIFSRKLNTPLEGWKRRFSPQRRPIYAKLWIYTLVTASVFILVALESAVFGILPGLSKPETILNVTLVLVLTSCVLYICSFIFGFAHDIERMESQGTQP